jgi:histidine ammonia-lyase
VTVILTGRDLRRDDVVRVARLGEPVELHADARARMLATRAIVDGRLASGDPVYGLSTAVGVLKRVELDPAEAAAYANRLLRQHRVAQGEPAARPLVRATMLVLANGFAAGYPGVRPALADRLIEALNRDETPRVRTLGSVGQADLAQMADLGAALFTDLPLEAGEGLALLGNNAFSTAAAALAVEDTSLLTDAMERAGALSLEGMAVNPSMLHSAIAAARPYPGLATALTNLRGLLEGSAVWDPASSRNLQDPLSFRNLPHILGALRDALTHVEAQLAIELDASQGNPIVVLDERRVVSVADFEILPLTAALDYLRIVLASVLGAAAERVVKLLETPWSGLPTGLSPNPDRTDPGLSYLGIAVQSLAAEARLLAAPVSYELVSTAHAEGIEDRTSLAPLAARRLDEMVGLGARVVAIELTVAAQAAELRGVDPRGHGTAAAAGLVRGLVPFLAAGDVVPDVEPLAEAVRRGEFSR